MNNVMVFDTETTGLDKPFCYDVGYVIMEKSTGNIILRRHFVIEQVWHNLPLFESAYYHGKRPIYIKLMRQHRAIMEKWGYAMQAMARDIKNYEISDIYAYNSSFDEKVFLFNCDWFKTINPLDNVAVHDIWGYASECITSREEYRDYCEHYELFTDTGNYKGSAESVYRFLMDDENFSEDHMGIYDSEIEAKILYDCIVLYGAEWDKDYKVNKILSRKTNKPFKIKINGVVVAEGFYFKKYVRNDFYNFTID